LLGDCTKQHELYLQQQELEKDQQQNEKQNTIFDKAPTFYYDIAISGTVIKLPFTAFGIYMHNFSEFS
jgi:hypothetical protein